MSKVKEKKNGGVIKKFLKTIFIAILLFALLSCAIIMIKANKYPDKIPDIFGYKPMIVLSGSMETSIFTGDLVFVKMVNPSILKIGDVVAFRNETNTVTTHRIINITNVNGKRMFQTKGDNNNAADANLVSEADIEGIYDFKISKLGNFLMFLQQPTGLAVILLAILIIGLIWLYIAGKRDAKVAKAEDAKYRQEFEEYKRMKQQEEQNRQNGQDELK